MTPTGGNKTGASLDGKRENSYDIKNLIRASVFLCSATIFAKQINLNKKELKNA